MKAFHYNYWSGNEAKIPLQFITKTKSTQYIFGLIDTGCPFILINLNLSKYLQLKPHDWCKDSSTPTGQVFKTGKATIDLIIGHAKRTELLKNVEIRVSEFPDNPKLPLVGRNPLFDWYNVTFDNDEQRCHLIPR